MPEFLNNGCVIYGDGENVETSSQLLARVSPVISGGSQRETNPRVYAKVVPKPGRVFFSPADKRLIQMEAIKRKN